MARSPRPRPSWWSSSPRPTRCTSSRTPSRGAGPTRSSPAPWPRARAALRRAPRSSRATRARGSRSRGARRRPTLATLRAWLSPDALREALAASLEEGSLGAAAFREVARVAQLWLPDARKGAVTPSLLYDVLRRHDPDHVLLRAQRHTLWTSLEGPRAEAALAEPRDPRWSLRVSDTPSPLAVPAHGRDAPRRPWPRATSRARCSTPRTRSTSAPCSAAARRDGAPRGPHPARARAGCSRAALAPSSSPTCTRATSTRCGTAASRCRRRATSALLARVDALLRACDPRRVIVAGDLVHGAAAAHHRTAAPSALDALLRALRRTRGGGGPGQPRPRGEVSPRSPRRAGHRRGRRRPPPRAARRRGARGAPRDARRSPCAPGASCSSGTTTRRSGCGARGG